MLSWQVFLGLKSLSNKRRLQPRRKFGNKRQRSLGATLFLCLGKPVMLELLKISPTKSSFRNHRTHVLEYSLSVASIVSVGHISTTALASATLGSMTSSVRNMADLLALLQPVEFLPSVTGNGLYNYPRVRLCPRLSPTSGMDVK